MRKLIYMQGNHGYTPPISKYFETNCDLPADKMGKLGYEYPGAGRIAVHIDDFIDILRKKGYAANRIEACDEECEKVYGVDGNY